MGNFAEYKGIAVFVETEEGRAKHVGYELLAPGRVLADKMGQELMAFIVGHEVEEAAKDCIAYGADQVMVVDGPEYALYTTDACVKALHHLLEKYRPGVMLIGATNNGRDAGPRLSCRMGTGLTADCTSLDIDTETGNMAWTRPAFGGNLLATIICPDDRPQLGTVRPGVFKAAEPDRKRKGIINHEAFHVEPEEIHTRLIERIKEVSEQVRLEDAKILVAGGKGMGNAENFSYLRELAEVMGGTVAASRAAVDAGWIPHAYQVGQTGKTVAPDIYIACGISGAIQHLVGMNGSATVIAINKDPRAPIFKSAHYGIVGDVKEVLPALTEALKRKGH